YLETQWDSNGNYNFERCADGGTCVRRVTGLLTSDKAPFIPRFTIDPQNAQAVYLTAAPLSPTDNGGAHGTPATASGAAKPRCVPCKKNTISLSRDHTTIFQAAGPGVPSTTRLRAVTLTDAVRLWVRDGFDKAIADCHRVPGAAWDLGRNLAAHVLKAKAGC